MARVITTKKMIVRNDGAGDTLTMQDAGGVTGVSLSAAGTSFVKDRLAVGKTAAVTALDATRIRHDSAQFYDEFWTGRRPEWATDVSTGSAAAVSEPNGIYRLTTGAVATNEESIDWDDITTFQYDLLPTFEVLLRPEQVTNIEIEVGLKESESIGTDDYIMMAFDASAQNTWYLQTSRTGSTTPDQGAVAVVDDTLLRFSLVDSSTVEWWINDVSQGSVTTNIPTVLLQPFIRVRTEETAAHYVDIDVVRIWQDM